MNSFTLNNQQKQELKEILTRIQKSFQTELNTPISNSYNVAMNFSMARAWNQMNQTFRKLCADSDLFLKNVSSCTLSTLKNYDENSSKSLNQIQTMFKSLSNQMQNKVAAHQQAKKKNPYAVGPTKAVINQTQQVLGAFFTHFKKINRQFQSINYRFIQKGNKNDPNIKGIHNNLNSQAPIQALEDLKSQVQFLYKSLHGSFQTATYLGLGRLWNQMMQVYQQISDITNGIAKNKASCNEKMVGEYYQKAMKSAYDIHSSIKQMMDELQKKRNTPICSQSLIIQAQNCQKSTVEYLEKIRNQLKIIKSKYPNIKQSSFQGFKKQPQHKRVQIQLTFKDLNEFMEDTRLHDLLDICVRQHVSMDDTKQKIIEIKYQSGKMQVLLEVTDLPQSQIQMFKSGLKRNIQRLIDFSQFNADYSKVLKKMLSVFEQKCILFESRNGRIVLVGKATEVKEQMASINNEINKNLKSTIKDFSLKQKSQLTLSKKFLQNKLREPQYSEIQVRFDQGKDIRITFFGQLLFVNSLISTLQQFIETLEGKIFDYNLNLTDQELNIIQNDEALKKHVQSNWNLTIKYNRNQIIPAQIKIQPHSSLGSNLPQKKILFETYFNFDSLPINALVFFKDQKQLQNMKRPCITPFKKLIQQSKKKSSSQFVVHKDESKNCVYYYTNGFDPLQIILIAKDNRILNNRHVFIYLPYTKTLSIKLMKIIQKLCQNQELIKSQTKITFICKKNQDIQSILGFKQGKNSCKPQFQRKWFAVDDKNKLFYSEKGNQKIQNAVQKKLNDVELTNQDLNMEVATHSFDFKRNIMTHTVTGKQFPLTVHPNKITFQLYGLQKQIPDSEYKKIPRIQGTNKLMNCQLSIGCYHIDLANKIQTNLFSVYQRKINCENMAINAQIYDFTIQYDIKTTNLVLQYVEENSKYIKTAVSYIKQNLNKRLIEVTQPFDKDFTIQLIRKFLSDAKQQNITVNLSNDKKSAVFRSYNDKNIRNFIKMLSYVGKISIQFPKQWQPQTQQIQTFIVPKDTLQFLNVQKAFSVGNIVELVRIQNKLIFKKYYAEKLCLQQLNGGKQIKQMLLYHGTSSADPKAIYEDKQESFNINYTSDRNFLGKGTYFAQRSQYSKDYSHVEDGKKGIYSMFYCRVLVGDSQKCPKLHEDYRNTDFKDSVNRIRYESMTQFLNQSNVFVVYKNRRAYPLYLIKFTLK